MNTYDLTRLVRDGTFFAAYREQNFILICCTRGSGFCWCKCCKGICKCLRKAGMINQYPSGQIIREEGYNAYITAVISLVSGYVADKPNHALSPVVKRRFSNILK